MRSSPKLLVVSRSEGNGQSPESHEPEGSERSRISIRSRRDPDENNEIAIRIRVSYKTLLLVIVIFDVLHRSINLVIDSSFFENLLGGG